MKLFIDEDAGSTLAKTLEATGFADDVDWVARGRLITPGTLDRDWIPQIGPSERIIISANIRMAQNALEARLLVENKARIVFIPNQAFADERLRLVLNRKPWLLHMDKHGRRPFAWPISMNGKLYDRKAWLRKYSRLPVP